MKPKYVHIKWNTTTSMFSQYAQSLETYTDSVKSVGSYFEKDGSRAIGSGLTSAQKNILLPALIGYSPEEREFAAKSKEFFLELRTVIPADADGLKLNIALEDETKPLSKDNMPQNVMDFIRYHHISGHPHVAKTQAEATGNSNKQFFVFDPTKTLDSVVEETAIKDEAVGYYLAMVQEAKVKKSNQRIDMMLTVLGKDIRNIAPLSKNLELRELADKKAKEFVDAYKDKSLAVKWFITRLVRNNIVKQVGNTYIDNNITLGRSEEETILWITDPTNAQAVLFLKERLQEKEPYNEPKLSEEEVKPVAEVTKAVDKPADKA